MSGQGAGRTEPLDLGEERPERGVDDEQHDQNEDDRGRLVSDQPADADAEGAEQGGDPGVASELLDQVGQIGGVLAALNHWMNDPKNGY